MRFVAAVLALLVVAGCGGSPQPKEPKPAESASATPTIAVPTMPAQAKKHSPEGAAAFVKHYIDVFNYAANTGDVAELSRLSHPQCEGCQRYIKLYRDTYAAGGYFRGGDWKLGRLDVSVAGTRAVVFGSVSSLPGTYRQSSRAPASPGNPESARLTFIANAKFGKWQMATLERQSGQ